MLVSRSALFKLKWALFVILISCALSPLPTTYARGSRAKSGAKVSKKKKALAAEA